MVTIQERSLSLLVDFSVYNSDNLKYLEQKYSIYLYTKVFISRNDKNILAMNLYQRRCRYPRRDYRIDSHTNYAQNLSHLAFFCIRAPDSQTVGIQGAKTRNLARRRMVQLSAATRTHWISPRIRVWARDNSSSKSLSTSHTCGLDITHVLQYLS